MQCRDEVFFWRLDAGSGTTFIRGRPQAPFLFLVLLFAQIFPEECDNIFWFVQIKDLEGEVLHDMENQQIQRSDLFRSDSGVSDQYFRRISILFGASAPKFSVRIQGRHRRATRRDFPESAPKKTFLNTTEESS